MLDDRLNALTMISMNRNFVYEVDNFDDKKQQKRIFMKGRTSDFCFKK